MLIKQFLRHRINSLLLFKPLWYLFRIKQHTTALSFTIDTHTYLIQVFLRVQVERWDRYIA